VTVAAPGVLANDISVPNTLTVTAGTVPTSAGGSATLAADGGFTYTPPGGGVLGADTFTYTITDARGATDTGVVSVSVNDAAPTVVSAGAVSRAIDTNLTVTFSEPVAVTGDWFVISCGTSGFRF